MDHEILLFNFLGEGNQSDFFKLEIPGKILHIDSLLSDSNNYKVN